MAVRVASAKLGSCTPEVPTPGQGRLGKGVLDAALSSQPWSLTKGERAGHLESRMVTGPSRGHPRPWLPQSPPLPRQGPRHGAPALGLYLNRCRIWEGASTALTTGSAVQAAAEQEGLAAAPRTPRSGGTACLPPPQACCPVLPWKTGTPAGSRRWQCSAPGREDALLSGWKGWNCSSRPRAPEQVHVRPQVPRPNTEAGIASEKSAQWRSYRQLGQRALKTPELTAA